MTLRLKWLAQHSVLLVLTATSVIFVLVYCAPGVRFENSLPVAYLKWVWGILTPGGHAAATPGTSLRVASAYTLTIAMAALVILMGMVLSISWMTAFGRHRRIGTILGWVCCILSSFPAISVSVIALVAFMAIYGHLPYMANFDKFPVGIRCVALALPVAILSVSDGKGADGFRHLREEIQRVAAEPFVVAIRARGTRVEPHIRRNLVPTIVSITSWSAASILGWTFVIEYLFNVKGLGFLLVDHFGKGRYDTVITITAISAVVLIIIDFTGRVIVSAFDPRL